MYTKNEIRKAHNKLVDETNEIMEAKQQIESQLAAINAVIPAVKPEVVSINLVYEILDLKNFFVFY